MASRPAITDPVRSASGKHLNLRVLRRWRGGRLPRRESVYRSTVFGRTEIAQRSSTTQVFPNKDRGGPKITFVSRPRANVVAPMSPASPAKRKSPGVLPVTPDSRPADCVMPPPLELDECGSPKRIRFYSSLSSVREHGGCTKCGGDTIKCRGHAFDRSDLDYFEPCAGRVCLECDAPECGTCAQPMPLPFCRACVEMVVYESGSFVADKPEYAQYLCKGGGDDCCCNALVCDDCHDKTTGTRTAAYASALKATRASALKENPLKYVVQEAVTAKTRLCEDCVERLEALGQDE